MARLKRETLWSIGRKFRLGSSLSCLIPAQGYDPALASLGTCEAVCVAMLVKRDFGVTADEVRARFKFYFDAFPQVKAEVD